MNFFLVQKNKLISYTIKKSNQLFYIPGFEEKFKN